MLDADVVLQHGLPAEGVAAGVAPEALGGHVGEQHVGAQVVAAREGGAARGAGDGDALEEAGRGRDLLVHAVAAAAHARRVEGVLVAHVRVQARGAAELVAALAARVGPRIHVLLREPLALLEAEKTSFTATPAYLCMKTSLSFPTSRDFYV